MNYTPGDRLINKRITYIPNYCNYKKTAPNYFLYINSISVPQARESLYKLKASLAPAFLSV